MRHLAMRRLLIVGAGGFGREVRGWVAQAGGALVECDKIAFLDKNPAALDGYSVDDPIIGDPAMYAPQEGDLFICAVGDPATKLLLCRQLVARGARFVTLLHPSAVVGPRCSVGTGCIICPQVVLTADVTLGDFVTVNVCATIGHDARVGQGCTISGHSDVTGFAVLGEGVFLGSHASVLPGAKVEDYAVVGAGSVVIRRVPRYSTVVGVPARLVFRKNAEQ